MLNGKGNLSMVKRHIEEKGIINGVLAATLSAAVTNNEGYSCTWFFYEPAVPKGFDEEVMNAVKCGDL